jgi:hypothetical protein
MMPFVNLLNGYFARQGGIEENILQIGELFKTNIVIAL